MVVVGVELCVVGVVDRQIIPVVVVGGEDCMVIINVAGTVGRIQVLAASCDRTISIVW